MEDKTMKKVFGIAALLLALAACNKVETEITPVEQPSDSKGITITATLAPKTAVTKAVADKGDNKITVTWAENEHIAILYDKDGAQVADATITAVDGTTGAATISFTVVSGTPDNTACTLVYPAKLSDGTTTVYNDEKTGVKDAATLLSAQDGTLNANLDVRVGAGTIRTTTPSLTVTTQPAAQFAIFKFTVKNADASATIDVKPLIITIGTQDYTITPVSATSTLYVALPAVSGQTVSFCATGSDSKTYTCSKDGVTFAAAKYYQSTLKMAAYKLLSAATAEDIGKVVGQDGNIYDTKAAAKVAGTQAVAMIAYVGSKTDNFAHKYGFAIALSDEGEIMDWSTAKSTCEGKASVSDAEWMLPSQEQWKAMFNAFGGNEGSYTGLNTALAIAGGDSSKLQEGRYWSSQPDGNDNAWRVVLEDGGAYWYNLYVNYKLHVRACLVFGDYTARPLAEATTDDLGKIAGADGYIYDTKAAAEAASTQAVAMIAYVGSETDHSTYKHGLAIALSDEGGMTWSTAKSTCEGKTAVSGAVWLLPSQEQWKAMFKAFGGNEGSYTGLNTALATAGDELKKDGSYWSSTPYDGGRAWYARLIDAQWRFDSMDYSLRVRACLAF